MDRLVEVYLSARPGDESRADPSLAVLLLALYTRGRATHRDVDLDDITFAEHLGRCGAPVYAGADGSAVHAEDLYLCCAALHGSSVAVRKLHGSARPVLASHLSHIDSSRAFLDEIEQQLWDALLVGRAGVPPKLTSYAGKGPLAAWLGVTAQRLALMQRRHEAVEGRLVERLGSETERLAADPELDFVKDRLREPFRQALKRGLEKLPDRERLIYRLHLIDGLSLERIAKMYGVAQSTMSRRVAGARKAILSEAKRVLQEEMQIGPEEYDSLARLLASALDLSVSRLLGEQI